MNQVRDVCQSFAVVMEMLEDRGYDVEECRNSYTETELTRIFLCANPGSILVESTDKNIRIMYFTLQQLKTHLKLLQAKKYDLDNDNANIHLIIIMEDTNHSVTKSLNETYKNLNVDTRKIKYQLFHIKDVLINISKHVLVPKHEVLTKEKEQQVLAQFMSPKASFPFILKTDPMARYLGLEPGQIVKITSASPTSGQYVSYRTCV